MSQTVTIVMYHYVRDLDHSPYPEIKGLHVNLFREQLHYLKKHYVFITMEELIGATRGRSELPSNAVLLTFDDGYMDHYRYVFPLLKEMGVQGSFFAPVKAIRERQLLTVNKVHFVLATTADLPRLLNDIYVFLDNYREEYGLESNTYYFEKFARPGRADPKEVIFVKRLLQMGLPESLREIIATDLFKEHVTDDETSFARELYMSEQQLIEMQRAGMHIGSHGMNHSWLNTLCEAEQIAEIDGSLEFLRNIECYQGNDWVCCYPYGGYNDSLISLLKQRGCSLALTTTIDIADLDRHDPYTLPRLDTNDLPKAATAAPNPWTRQVSITPAQ